MKNIFYLRLELPFKKIVMFFFMFISISLFFGCPFHLSEKRELLRPNGVAVGADGVIYVMDRGNYRIAVLSPKLEYVRSIGKIGRGSEGILRGWDLALDSDENIYLANVNWMDGFEKVSYEGIKMFTKEGINIKNIGEFTSLASEERYSPYGVHLSKRNHIYIPSFYKNVVRVFDKGDNELGMIDVNASTGTTRGLVDVVTDLEEKDMYVTDMFRGEVRKYQLLWNKAGKVEGKLEKVIGGKGKSPFFSYPQYMTWNQNSHTLFVSDMGNQRVIEIDDEGRIMREFKLSSTWQPLGVALDNDNRLLVADAFGNQIVRFLNNGSVEISKDRL